MGAATDQRVSDTFWSKRMSAGSGAVAVTTALGGLLRVRAGDVDGEGAAGGGF